jgi:hypothetical protein
MFISDIKTNCRIVLKKKCYEYQDFFKCVYQDIKVKVMLSLCLTERHAMKAYWGSGGISPCIELVWPASRLDRFNPRERAPGTH